MALGCLILLRARGEWSSGAELSLATSIGGWLAYTLHAALVVWATIANAWPLSEPGAASIAVGAVLIALGAAMFGAGATAFRSLGRMQGTRADRLVTWGVYRYSRHPQNVGWGIALIGAAVAGLSGLALLLAAVYWAVMPYYLPLEERNVERLIGDEYRDYRRRAPALLGRPR